MASRSVWSRVSCSVVLTACLALNPTGAVAQHVWQFSSSDDYNVASADAMLSGATQFALRCHHPTATQRLPGPIGAETRSGVLTMMVPGTGARTVTISVDGRRIVGLPAIADPVSGTLSAQILMVSPVLAMLAAGNTAQITGDGLGADVALKNSAATLNSLVQYCGRNVPPAQFVRPSFDCRKAGTVTEIALCTVPELAEVDVAVDRAFRLLQGQLPTGAQRDRLLYEQSVMLQNRDRCGDDTGCLLAVLRNRLHTLEQAVPLPSAGPVADAPSRLPTPGTQLDGGAVPAQHAAGGKVPSANATMAMQQGVPIVDGHPTLFLNSYTTALKSDDAQEATSDWLGRFSKGVGPELLRSNQYVDFLLTDLDAAQVSALLKTALGRAPERNEIQLMQKGLVSTVIDSEPGREFVEARYYAAARDLVRTAISNQGIARPATVRLVCSVRLEPYDFTAQVIQFEPFKNGHDCRGIDVRLGRFAGNIAVDPGVLPDTVPMATADAERLIGSLYNGFGLLSFEARMDVGAGEKPGYGTIALFSATRTGPISLHSRDGFPQPLVTFDDAALSAAADARLAREDAAEAARLRAEAEKEEERLAAFQARREAEAARRQDEEARKAEARREQEAERQAERDRQQAARERAAGVSFPVLGVSLGDPFVEAEAMLMERNGFSLRLTATTEFRQNAGNNARLKSWEAFHNGVLLISPEAREHIAIYNEPPAHGGEVTGISRSRFFPQGQGPSFEQTRNSIVTAYGEVQEEDLARAWKQTGYLVLWPSTRAPTNRAVPQSSSEGACKRSLNAAAGTEASSLQNDQKARRNDYFRANDGLGIWMNDAGEQIVPEVSNPVSMHDLFGGRSKCPDTQVIVFLFDTDESGRLTAFHQAVARPAWAASIAQEREAAAMSSGGDAKLDL